jgi:CDP-diacylglycerol--glycerol-3-phosphate 3-phosphatidyltransferase
MNHRAVRLLPAQMLTGFPGLLSPVAEWLIRWRVRPNVITSASVIVLVGSGVAFGLDQARLGAAWLLLSGLLDMLDGLVARRGGMVSTFGALFDSTLDRVGEAALFGGIAVFFVIAPNQVMRVLGVVFAIAALAGSFLVSYVRARAEGLGIECRVGIVQRPERILGVGVPTLLFGTGPHGVLLLVIMGVLAVLSWISMGQRVAYVHRAVNHGAPPPAGGRAAAPGRSDHFTKGS